MKFKDIISLGNDCRVRYQIAQFKARQSLSSNYSKKSFESSLYNRNNFPKYHVGETNVFDWCITPQESIVKLLSTPESEVLQLENLFVNGEGVIVDSVTGIKHVHDFKKENGEHTFDTISGQHPRAREKFLFLLRRFKEMDAQNVVLVRKGMDDGQFENIYGALTEFTSLINPVLMKVQLHDGESYFQQVNEFFITYYLNNDTDKPPQQRWQGDDLRWQTMFDSIFLQQ